MRGEQPRPLLLVADRVRTLDAARPSARAVLTDGGHVRWVGERPEDAPPLPAGASPRRVDLRGAELHPAFVDAHAHLTTTGLGLIGLDLRDCRSVADCLAAVRAIAGVTPGRVIWGGGWDEFDWVERRAPTADELADASGGLPVYLVRVDGHSAVVDRTSLGLAPLARCDGVERDRAGRPTGLLRREATHVGRRWFLGGLPASQLAEAREAVAAHLASLGVASAHEMGGPDRMGLDDFDTWLEGEWPIEVVGYWGDLDLDLVTVRGLRQVGGALHLDGTIGSRTAALESDYADGQGRGHLYRELDELVSFTAQATRSGIQVAFHCIGDRAVAQAVALLDQVADRVGVGTLRACRPRLEHVPMVRLELAGRLAQLGGITVVSPGFERRWGGPDRLYAHRLGPDRASITHPLRPLRDRGVRLAFGSGTDLAPSDPWESIAAATGHHRPELALDEDAALEAATRGGRVAAHDDGSGIVAPGMRADLAATAARGATRECVLTLVGGVPVHDRAGASA